MAKRSKFFIYVLIVAAFYTLLIRAALYPAIPSAQNPLVFYSNQCRDDLRLVLQKLFRNAHTSIDMTMYALTDELLLNKLLKKAQNGISVHIRYDPSSGCAPLTPPLKAIPVKAKGLMHRKIVILDSTTTLLGSANMTSSSLVLHDNLSVGLYHPALAHFLQAPTSNSFDFQIAQQTCKLWLLPDPEALLDLQHHLSQATSSIFVAMFTLTHPELLKTLIQAHQRGIDVTVAMDLYAARGASRKAVHDLQAHGVRLLFSQGQQLLHHKWAYIDQSSIVLGSTNWTKAAFSKNQDVLLFVHQLSLSQKKFFNQLCHTITLESNTTL